MSLAEKYIAEAVALRERKAEVDAELASLRRRRPPRSIPQAVSESSVILSQLYGPLLRNGLFFSGGRCPTCGHRLSA